MIMAGIIYFPSLASIIMVLFAVIAAPVKILQEKIAKTGIFGWKKGITLSVIFIVAVLLAQTNTKNNEDVAQSPSSQIPVQSTDKTYSPAPSMIVNSKENQTPMPTEKPELATKQIPEIKFSKAPESTATPGSSVTFEQKPEIVPAQAETPKPTKNTNNNGKGRRRNWPSGSYLGSTESDKYHDYECRAAKTILSENEVWFSSEEAAKSAGYSRCGICW